jgi:hypothetical protein
MDMFGPKKQRGWNVPHETSRLLMPRADPGESLAPLKFLGAQSNDVEANNRATDSLIQGLVDRLPKSNGIWSLDDRVKWLRTAASIFDLVYKAGDGERRDISIVFITAENPPVTELPVAEAIKESSPVEESHLLSDWTR